MNTLKTAFLLTLMTVVLVLVGGHFGGRNGMILAFVVSVGMNFFSYFYSDKLALSMYRAQPATREELPRVPNGGHDAARRPAHAEDLYHPHRIRPTHLHHRPGNPQHASVAVTQGILDAMNA